MLSSINQSNTVQSFNAINAFKNSGKAKNEQAENNQEELLNVSSGTQSNNAKSLLDLIDVNDVRECAKTVGEFNISDDDIKYGLMYGRSVIAEYLC